MIALSKLTINLLTHWLQTLLAALKQLSQRTSAGTGKRYTVTEYMASHDRVDDSRSLPLVPMHSRGFPLSIPHVTFAFPKL